MQQLTKRRLLLDCRQGGDIINIQLSQGGIKVNNTALNINTEQRVQHGFADRMNSMLLMNIAIFENHFTGPHQHHRRGASRFNKLS